MKKLMDAQNLNLKIRATLNSIKTVPRKNTSGKHIEFRPNTHTASIHHNQSSFSAVHIIAELARLHFVFSDAPTIDHRDNRRGE